MTERKWTQDEIDDEMLDDDEDSFAEMACGRTPSGGCSQIGTEYCDWSCPFSGSLLANRSTNLKDRRRK